MRQIFAKILLDKFSQIPQEYSAKNPLLFLILNTLFNQHFGAMLFFTLSSLVVLLDSKKSDLIFLS